MSRSERFQFEAATPDGGLLAGILDTPEDAPRAYALIAHCFTCSKDFPATKRISRALAEQGVATLRIDFTGLGESEGEFAASSFSGNIDDLLAAAAFLEREHRAPTLLIGHSLGGAAVIAAAERLPHARAIATIGAPSDPKHVARLFTNARQDIERDGEAEVSIGGRPFTIKTSFLDDLKRHALTDVLAQLRKPLLILHAPADAVVSIDHARVLFEAAFHPKSFVSLDDADHLLSRPRDAQYTANIIAAWASRYVDNNS
jgi:fermentation-respiration switch protein FrsA (DUF1100 family)